MTLNVSDGFPYYISLTEGYDIKMLFNSRDNFQILDAINEEKSAFRYAAGKWSIKQIIGHITDHERIMTYRALRFSRKDTTPLSGYDQELFVQNSRFDELTFKSLVTDFKNVREATLSFINNLSDQQLKLKGLAWKFELTVEEALRATIGHEKHHMDILKEKYLNRNFQ